MDALQAMGRSTSTMLTAGARMRISAVIHISGGRPPPPIWPSTHCVNVMNVRLADSG